MFRPILKEIDGFRAEHGLEPLGRWDRSISPLAVICNMTPSLDFSRPLRGQDFSYTGPYLDRRRESVSFPYERLDDKPIVYASMGTLHTNQAPIYRLIAEVCRDLSVQLVVSLGKWRDPEGGLELPGDPIVTPYAPQVEILERAAIAVTHGGMNTVMEALSQGCPVLALPVASD